MRGQSGIFAQCSLPDHAPVAAVLLPDLFSVAVSEATDETLETFPELHQKDVLIVSVVIEHTVHVYLFFGNMVYD